MDVSSHRVLGGVCLCVCVAWGGVVWEESLSYYL